jgi:hypothetical protein
MPRAALLIVLLSLLLLTACGSEGDAAPPADAATQRWMLAYTRQLDRWADGAQRMATAIDQEAWGRLGRVVRRMGRDGDRVRERFARVPATLAGARERYALLVEAGDAASAWARLYRTDPPPYLGNAAGLRKEQALADAAADFQAKVNRAAAAAP